MQPTYHPPEHLRYSAKPFPAYRFLPFQPHMPHPRNDPQGHSYAEEEESLPPFVASDWSNCESCLYGVDLFNHGYWWEAHEAWEAVWLAAGQTSEAGLFVQGLIQMAGAQLKRVIDEPKGAKILTEGALEKLAPYAGVYLGIEIASLRQEGQRCFTENQDEYPTIVLQF